MSTFDPMAAALDWLDAYRAASYSIVNMYSKTALLEYECCGPTTLVGHTAIAHYWRGRFEEQPAGELVDLRPDGDSIAVCYRVPGGADQALLNFDDVGKI
jgi:hypothetical protein